MNDVNLIAILVSAIAAFAFGAFWYSPVCLLNRWCSETGVDVKAGIQNPAKVYGLTFVFTLVAAFIFANLLGPDPSVHTGVSMGLAVGAGLVMASIGINYQFAGNSNVHWLIDGGFHVGRFVVMGVVLGLWN